MNAWSDQHLMEMALIDLSNELRRLQRRVDLRPREKAQRLIRISRDMREVSNALRAVSAHRRFFSPASRNAPHARSAELRGMAAIAAE